MAARRLIKARRRLLSQKLPAHKRRVATGPQDSAKLERAREMANMYCGGMTLEAVGAEFGVTRERVRQILVSVGVDAKSGGMKSKTAHKEAARQKLKKELSDISAYDSYGCSRETVEKISKGISSSSRGSVLRTYIDKRRSAKNRDIEWLFNLETWWEVWEKSGRWAQRGRGKHSYCMARNGDCGPYSPDNVRIVTIRENSEEAFDTKPHDGRKVRFPRLQNGLSQKQQTIYDLYTSGVPLVKIAKQMNIQAQTVGTHLNNAKHILGILK